MPRFLTDENLHTAILQGLRRRQPELDIVRVQDVGLRRANDHHILEWAAAEQRVLLTHDLRTMPGFVYERLAAGLPVPGVVIIDEDASTGQVIEELLELIGAAFDSEWVEQVHHLPLR